MAGENSYAGKQIGNYHVLSRLAGGAFGSVYLARHAVFARRPVVAIKLLHAHLNLQEERDRFLQEARWLEMLSHPHILSIFDAGIHEDYPYLVTEYAAHGSLHGHIKRLSSEPLSMQEGLSILLQVAEALQYAHEQNIIHRDLTPGNILFNVEGEVLLADFGVATMLATASIQRTANPIGTPPYMAPEQFQGEISKAIDQYALGCIAYELFTGQRPFSGSAAELMYKHISIPPRPPRELNPDLPRHVEQAILKALAKKREDRFADVSAFAAALQGEAQTRTLNNGSSARQQSRPLPEQFVDAAPPLVRPASRPLSAAETLSLPPKTARPLSSSPSLIPRTPASRSIVHTGPAPVTALHPARSLVHPSLRLPRPARSLVLILLVLSLLFAAFALAAPSTFISVKNLLLRAAGGVSTANTVTITPKSVDLQNTYVITGVTTGAPDSTLRQVRARVLTPVTDTQTQTVSATGAPITRAARATGTLTFFNGSDIEKIVSASTFALSANGVQIKITADVVIPAATPNGIGTASATAYADPPGANGNIPALTINEFCCSTDKTVSVRNSAAFSGGTNASTETTVQQSDINNAVNALEGPLKQAALASPNFQRQEGEQFLPGSLQCNTVVSSNPAVGQPASSAVVTVTVRCSGEVYDKSGAQAIAESLLQSDAARTPGPGYVLAGNISTITTHSAPDSTGMVTLFIRAEDIWVYGFTGAQKAALAQLIAGKSQEQAAALLAQQAGVQKVDGIAIAGGISLPSDARLITIVVERVAGEGDPSLRSG